MPEDAVLDSPDLGTEVLDTTSQDTSVDTSADGGSADQVDNHDTPQEGETGHLRGAELYRAVKDKLKSAGMTPQQIRSIRNAIHIAGKADEMTGGDLSRFDQERTAYESLRFPGEEAYTPEQVVEQVRADRQQLQDIFSDIQAGGDKMIEELITDSPESFQSMTVKAMDRFAQVNNEAFSTYVAKSAFGYLSNQQVPQQFALLDRFLPESSTDPATQIVIDAFKTIKTALTGLGSMAQKPLDIKKPTAQPQNGNGNSQEQDLATREHNIRRMEWDNEAAPTNRTLRDTEIQEIVAARKTQLTEKERTEVLAAINEEFSTRISLHKNVLKGYVDANNKRAYTDRVTSEGKKLLPSMVQRHVNAVIDKRPAGQTQQKPGQKPAQQSTEGKKDATGTVWISGSPASIGLQVDLSKTTHAMLSRNEAFIKGRSGLHKWKARVA